MAVIKPKSAGSSLQALTAAALLLPGLLQSPTCVADDAEADFQYSHYQEGQRQLYGVKSKFDPIEVDSLHGGAKMTLADRVKFSFNYTQDTWSGATPITTAPLAFGGNQTKQIKSGTGKTATYTTSGASPLISPNGNIFVDKSFNPLVKNTITTQTTKINKQGKTVIVKNTQDVYLKNKQLVHTLSAASPETRQQGDFKLGYEWDEAALEVGGGISDERDYESRFVNLAGRWDLNQKQTSLNTGLSYTNSSTFATLDHDALPYIDTKAFKNQIKNIKGGGSVLSGQKEDWATHLGFTQVINKDALVEMGVGYTRSTGYMSNPYKVMEILFVDPKQLSSPSRDQSLPNNVLTGQVQAFLEQRPEVRNQFNLNSRYVQHIDGLDAALHLDYRFYHDDWGIDAHTFEMDWAQPVGDSWQITPRVRYYSQDAADFYAPYLLSKQAYSRIAYDKNGMPIFNKNGSVKTIAFDRSKLPNYFSSDQRLSGYGTLSGGVTVSKKFSKGLTLEAGFEYYTHKGGLKLGSGGAASYADFNSYTVNAALKVNLAALANARSGSEHSEHAGHLMHGSHAPAGVMFDHMLHQADEIMLGYRYMYNFQGGEMRNGSNSVADWPVRKNACGNKVKTHCSVTPNQHTMQMHMLDLMYAPTDWLNLMLMPQFMSMDMELRQLKNAPADPHAGHKHETGGIGDTSMYALLKLFDNPEHHLHVAVGVSAPTGNVGIKLRPAHQEDPGFIHYGMQLGSGTWDFKPSLTYTGQTEDWSWGAQFSGIKRLQNHNKSGFAFGDMFQSTVWGGYNLFSWLSASVRGIYTTEGSIKGQYNELHPKTSPLDFPGNYGGQYWDVGFGLNATVTGGDFTGNRLAFEWQQPVADKVNGYQLNREGALSVAWGYAF